MIISRVILLIMRNISGKSCKENQNTFYVQYLIPRKSCRVRDNVEKCGRAREATDGNITRRMRFACAITKATDTHSEYIILIAFPRKIWLRERAWMLRLYVHCLSCLCVSRKITEDTVFWRAMLCSLVDIWRRFRGACCFHRTTRLQIAEDIT
jgi:hypothetical protein